MHECAINRNENRLEDLISKKSLIATIEKEAGMNIPEWLRETIMNAPPVQKTGEWEWDENAVDWGIGAWICSECKNDPQTYWSTDNANDPYEWGSSQYCPNCGAKMGVKE